MTTSASRRQTYTGEQGRFEFPSMEAGAYSLTASTQTDPEFVSEPFETNTNRTATTNLTVNLVLREVARAARPKARAINAAEAEQRIPKESRKAFSQGLKFKEQNEHDKALDRFNRAIDLYPDYFQAISERGDLYVLLRKLNEAAADFDRALKINGQYGPAWRGAGYCKLEKKEFAEAIEDFERSLSAEADNANTYLLLGIANLELDRREPARRAFLKALSFANHAVPRAHIYLANVYALDHQFQQAADELHKYLEAEPGAADAKELREMEAKWRARAAIR